MKIEPAHIIFGINVRELRKARSMTQQQIAKKVGHSRTSIVNIESGRQRVLLHEVDTFARAFGVSPAKLAKGIWS